MRVIDNIAELRIALSEERSRNKKIGLVPTMGALHHGHISLIDRSNQKNDLTICSIFVNPTQFNKADDLIKYPKQLGSDLEMLEASNCDIVFNPSVEEMYPEPEVMRMSFGQVETVLEGEFRPGHFSGVGIVVSKLFNITAADTAYFGQKDLQQVAIIKKMVSDLNFDIQIEVVPTVREESGLAMSSRNLRLSDDGRVLAVQLYNGLIEVRSSILEGVSFEQALLKTKEKLLSIEGIELEYMEVVDSLTMQKVEDIAVTEQVSICGAAYVGDIRIIDNIYLNQKT